MSENILLMLKNRGACGELKGHVRVCVMYIDEPDFFWDKAQIERQNALLTEVLQYLMRQAAESGVSLRFSCSKEHLRTPRQWKKEERDVVCTKIAKKHGFPSLAVFADRIKKTDKVDQVAFVFMHRRPEQSFADAAGSGSPPGDGEAAFIYDTEFNTLLHEFLHLFGAADLYYPGPVSAEAVHLFTRSIMRDARDPNSREIDSLTRYLIGWTDTLSPEARRLISVAEPLTMEDVQESIRNSWNTPYTVVYYPFGTYYGPLVNGGFQGKGRFEYDDGTVYEGEYVKSTRHGRGKLRLPDGTVYEGEFTGGQITGKGTMVFPDGKTQKGFFENAIYKGL